MSYYYNYYLGVKKDDGKIYPLGPYDRNGKLSAVLWKSRSFASDLHNRFRPIPDECVSDELRKEFSYTDFKDESVFDMTMCNYDELSQENGIRRGYCLTKDVMEYIRSKEGDEDSVLDVDELRYEMLSPEEFAVKAKDELEHGVPKPEKDCEGYEIPVYSCKDYTYFAFMDIVSEGYESEIIRNACSMFEFSDDVQYKMDKIVILLSEG